MSERARTQGFSILTAIIILAIVSAIALGGWRIWQSRQDKQSNNNHTSESTADVEPEDSDTETVDPVDPTEGGKYLVIKEWGVRVAIPESMQGEVSYSLSDTDADPDGNLIQAASILIREDFLSEDNICAPEDGTTPPVVQTGAQYIRSQTTKPFNAERYRWTFKENILTDANYNYHLSYVTPGCVGSEENETLIKQLQTMLVQLEKQ